MSDILIVEARFYEDIADELVAGASEVLTREGFGYERISVAGAFEIPGAIAMATAPSAHGMRGPAYRGFLGLGCIIRGETSHYDIVAGESARGLMDLAVRRAIPLANGILTVENREQAEARAFRARANKGAEFASALIGMMRLQAKFGVTTI